MACGYIFPDYLSLQGENYPVTRIGQFFSTPQTQQGGESKNILGIAALIYKTYLSLVPSSTIIEFQAQGTEKTYVS
jgi:hypothetical protein